VTVDRWHRLEQVLDAALTRDPADREAALAESCSGDPELRAEAEALLARLSAAEGFLASPPVAAAAALVAEAREERTAPDLAGRRIGAYRTLKQLGQGGMSRVFLAERADGAFEQQVALKLLRPGLDSDIDLERLRAERQILATLNHPNIARLLDGGMTEEGRPYLVLEYVDGQPIDRYCDTHALSVSHRLALFQTVATATQYAHRSLVVHRDLKPSNIFVTTDGTVKLLDFGLAKLLEPNVHGAAPATRTGQRWMTPEYAAPEQVRGEPVTTLTDVYQLGVVLYELLTGRLPFADRRRSLHELEEAILRDEPPLPSSTSPAHRTLRGDVDAIVMKALRKEPERRYPSAAALVEDIRRLREGRPVEARPDGAAYRMRKFVGRHRGGVALAAMMLVLLAAAGLRERTLRGRAEAEAERAKAVEEYLVSVFDVADPFAPPSLRSGDVTARALLDRGAAGIDSALAGHPADQAEMRNVFGRVYANLGLYDEATSQLRRSLEARRALYGPRHPAVAEAMDELGQTLLTRDRLDEAEPLLRDALAQRRELLGRRHALTAETLDHLATLLRERNDFAGADSLYREALAIRRSLFGPRDLAVATSLSNLGLLLFWKGAYDDAEPLYREAISIQEEKLGRDHPRTAQTVQNLAQVQQLRGRLDEAEALFRRALAAKRKSLGSAHPSVTVNLNNLASLLGREQGRLDEAESLVREALALDRQMFGENHANVAASLDNLATILREKGELDEAERLYRQALSVNRAVFGTEHNSVALNLNNIAGVLRLKGEPGRAVPLLRESLALYRRLLEERHPYSLAVALNLGRALRESAKLAEAERIFRDVARGLDRETPQQRPQFIAAQVGLGQTLTAAGRADEARPLLEEAVAMSVAHYGPEHLVTADARLALGTCLLATKRYAEAEPLLRDAYAVLQKHSRAQARLARESALALERLYRALGRPDEARRYAVSEPPRSVP
jgi:serine/threonine-protein kinase